MFNLKRNTKRTIILVILLYLVAWGSSLSDMAGRSSNLFCGLVTVVLILSCAYAGIRAIILARKIEHSPRWYSHCCCRKSATQVVLGYALLMFLLGLLKLWSIVDVFVDYWSFMPMMYHARAWAYLAQNGMDVLMAIVVLGIFEEKYKCAQHPRVFKNNGYEIS